jgi:hypothetical protein
MEGQVWNAWGLVPLVGALCREVLHGYLDFRVEVLVHDGECPSFGRRGLLARGAGYAI